MVCSNVPVNLNARSLLLLQINDKMSGHVASEGDINAMVKEVSDIELECHQVNLWRI